MDEEKSLRQIIAQSSETGELGAVLKLFENWHVNDTDEFGQSAAHYACERNNIDVLKLLKDEKADFMLANNEGKTPLHIAAESKSKEAVKFLLLLGVDADIMDNSGKKAHHYADVVTAACFDSFREEEIERVGAIHFEHSFAQAKAETKRVHAEEIFRKGANAEEDFEHELAQQFFEEAMKLDPSNEEFQKAMDMFGPYEGLMAGWKEYETKERLVTVRLTRPALIVGHMKTKLLGKPKLEEKEFPWSSDMEVSRKTNNDLVVDLYGTHTTVIRLPASDRADALERRLVKILTSR